MKRQNPYVAPRKETSTGGYKKKVRYTSLSNPPSKTKSPEEKKNTDVNQASPIVFGTTTATVALLNGTAQGASEIQRLGRNFHMKSIQWRFTGHLAPTTTGASAIRLLIVYDKQPNGALAAATDILVANSIENPMNLANNKRFIVIADEEVGCLGTQGPQAFHSKGYRKINLPTECQGNGGTIAGILTGALISLVFQDGGLLVASPSTQLYTRLRFIDA